MTTSEGPYFDDLEVGQTFTDAPAMTLTDGLTATHQAILGERMRLAMDSHLARRVTGGPRLVAPSVVWNVAIGQSTLATRHVKANLFYRNLSLLRFPAVGDTLSTVTDVVALRENTRRQGRAPTGLAALHIKTDDQEGRPVLDFYRCAMLPLRSDETTGHADDLDRVGAVGSTPVVPAWDLDAWRHVSPTSRLPEAGDEISISGGDVVSSAPELARLTLNVAAVHHDSVAAGGERLVYGGHTIGLALAQVTRAMPGLATVLSWHSCDHLGPVSEGDTLRSVVTVNEVRPDPSGWHVLDLRVETRADEDRAVLDWRLTALA